MGEIRTHRDLIAWQRAIELGLGVYELSRAFPDDERFGLTAQARRSAVSIAANIAEGYGRGSRQDYLRFLRMARGSLRELDTHLVFAERLAYIDTRSAAPIRATLEECSRLLAGLIKSLENSQTR